MQPKTQWYCIVGKAGIRVFMKSAVFTKYVDQAPLTASERAQWKAEAKALRAIYYFYLVRTYGPVPVLEDDYALDTPSNELQLSRSTVDRCFDFIVSE